MNILLIHQHFLRADEGGGSRFNQMARMWVDSGHSVTVLAGTVHYSTGEIRRRRRWTWREASNDGVTVLRCPMSRAVRAGLFGRAWSFLSYALAATWAGFFLRGRYDVVLASSPPLFAAIPGYVVSRLKRAALVFEVRDLWPDFAVEMGVIRNRYLIRLSYGLERFIYKKSDAVNVLTPAFRDELVAEGVRASKILFIPNGADLDLIEPGERENWVRELYGWGDDFVAMYTGAHGDANALHQLVDAAAALPDGSGIRIVLVGDGSARQRLMNHAEKHGIRCVEFIPSQPKDLMGAFIAAADVCVAVLADIEGFEKVYPNKVFDYMAGARPTILGIGGVSRRLVEGADAGIAVAPESPHQIAEAILRLKQDPDLCRRMGEHAREYVVQNFDRRVLAEQYERELRRIVRDKAC